MIIVPEKCLICGADYHGGAEVPGKKLTPHLRVFYTCGASLSYIKLAENACQVLIKNCGDDK